MDTTIGLAVSQQKYLPAGAGEQELHAIVTVEVSGADGAAPGPALAEVLVVDCSTSMDSPEEKFRAAKNAAVAAIGLLPDGTPFAVVAGTQFGVAVYPPQLDGTSPRMAVASAATRAEAETAVRSGRMAASDASRIVTATSVSSPGARAACASAMSMDGGALAAASAMSDCHTRSKPETVGSRKRHASSAPLTISWPAPTEERQTIGRAPALENIKTLHLRKSEVEDRRGVRLVQSHGITISPVVRAFDSKSCSRKTGYKSAGDFIVIFYQQYANGRVSRVFTLSSSIFLN